jgi:hypothetical protein
MVAIFGASGGADAAVLVLAAFLVFVLSFTVLNTYSRQVIARFSGRVNIYLGDDSPAWASRM